MPITIYPTSLKYKNSNGIFQSATAIKGDSGEAIVEQVSGTNPIIVCEDNHRYICGEVLSLNITPSANGVSEIIFTSGSSAAVLTVPSTIKWPEWFNPNVLETNATYQLKITNNLANVAMWPEEGLTGDTRVRILKMLGIYEPPWELIRNITLTERTSIDVSVDDNGNPFELLQVYVHVLYDSNLVSESSGYGRYYFYDANNDYITAETGRYSTSEYNSFKEILFEKKGNMRFAYFTSRTNTGNGGTWLIKTYPVGIKLNTGNIVRIKMNDTDFEPAGTKIFIYGQRAY